MFDPTAFENIRVVMEGILYDYDLAGDIIIIDRNDLINTAKLSRIYDISFQLTQTQQVSEPKITCKVSLTANLENLSAELLPTLLLKREAGCVMNIEYTFEHEKDDILLKQIEKIVRDSWNNITYKQTLAYEPLKKARKITHRGLIIFDHILRENEMNELPNRAEQIMTTLLRMEQMVDR